VNDNFFDQFDSPGNETLPSAAASAPSPSGNYFDQFDSPAGTVAAPATAPQMSGGWRLPAMAGTNLVGGLTHLMDSLSPSPMSDPATATAIYQAMPEAAGAFSRPQSWATPAAQRAGIADRTDLAPQTATEKAIAGAAQGVGASLPLLPLTGPLGLFTGAGGGAGAEAGREVGGNFGHPDIGAVLGGLIGGTGAGFVGNLGTRAVNAARGANLSDLGQAYDTAGVPKLFPAAFSENPSVGLASSYAAKNVGSAGVMQRAASTTTNAFGNSVEQTARQIEGTPLPLATSVDQIGADAQKAARLWMWGADSPTPGMTGVMQDNINQMYRPVDAFVNGTAPVYLNNLKSTLKGIKDIPGLEQTSAAVPGGSSVASDMLEGIKADLNGGTWPTTWNAGRALMSKIGAALGTPEIKQSAAASDLGSIYGALKDDLRSTAARFGVDRQWDAANSGASQLYNFRDNLLTNLVGTRNAGLDNITPAQAGNWLATRAANDPTIMGSIRANLPPVADSTAAYKLRDMAAATAGNQNAAGTAISPRSFLTDWNRLSPESKNSLYPDPQIRARVDALAKVSESTKQAFSLQNTSNTQPNEGLKQVLEAIGMMAGGQALGGEFGGAGLLLGGTRAAMPAINWTLAHAVANRPLASMMATKSPLLFGGQSPAIGAYTALAGPQRPNLLTAQ